MSQHRLGKLYIRRLKPSDKATHWGTGIEINLVKALIASGVRRKSYVMVRHGFPKVMAIGTTRLELEKRMLSSAGCGRKAFKRTAMSWKLSLQEIAMRAVKGNP